MNEPKYVELPHFPTWQEQRIAPGFLTVSNAPLGIWVVFNTLDRVPLTYHFNEIDALRDALDEGGCDVLFWSPGIPWLDALSAHKNR